MPKLLKLWLSRDRASGFVVLWKERPTYSADKCYFYDARELSALCRAEFEQLTGIALAPGECRQVTISVELSDGKTKTVDPPRRARKARPTAKAKGRRSVGDATA